MSAQQMLRFFVIGSPSSPFQTMKYVNASNILPKKLIAEIQKYVQGETLYIPKLE